MASTPVTETDLLLSSLEQDLRNTEIRIGLLRCGVVDREVDELDTRARRLKDRIKIEIGKRHTSSAD